MKRGFAARWTDLAAFGGLLRGTLFTAVAGYLFKIYLARVLGADALGMYALGMTIVGFFGLFNGLGLPQAAVRFVAAYSATEHGSACMGFFAGHSDCWELRMLCWARR